ncbi:MAG: DUF6090 family protein [Cyclobacteriaceae bacterium]
MQKNKITTYLLYAIGEIVLVVIGILIAVSIDDWNQAQKNLAAEKVLLRKVLTDLEVDASGFIKNRATTERIADFHHDCFGIILGKREVAEVAFKDPNLTRRTLYYIPLTRDNHPDLVNRVSIEELKEPIAAYFRWMKTMDAAFVEFVNVVDKIRSTISMKKGHNLAALYDKSFTAFNMDGNVVLITRESLLKLLKDEYFQQLLLESNLKLQDTQASLDSLISQNTKLKSMISQSLAK